MTLIFNWLKNVIANFFARFESLESKNSGTTVNLNIRVDVRRHCDRHHDDPKDFIGTIKMFAGLRPPDGWLFCDGRLLNVRDYVDLFTVIGNTYGGNGRTNFALPDLRGRVPVGTGRGENLKERNLGEPFGSEIVSIKIDQIPLVTTDDLSNFLSGTIPADVDPDTGEKSRVVTSSMKGRKKFSIENKPISSIQPSIGMNYIICYRGEYPDDFQECI